MKHFKDMNETLAYIAWWMVATMEEDLHKMKETERWNYSDSDRRELRNRLDDVREAAALVTSAYRLKSAVAAFLTGTMSEVAA